MESFGAAKQTARHAVRPERENKKMLPANGSTTVSEADGIVRIVLVGMHAGDEVRENFAMLEAALSPYRRAGRPAKLLVDSRAMPILSAETADLVRAGVEQLHRAHDMIALLVLSRLAVLQFRRILVAWPPSVFEDETEALTWLHTKEDDPKVPLSMPLRAKG